MNNHKHITDLHREILEWKSQIEFCKDEIKVMQNRLGEIASKNNEKEVMAQLEHLQNQAFRQLEVSDQLYHDLKIKDQDYATLVKQNPVASDRKLAEDHHELREKIDIYGRLYNEFKGELHQYASRWM